MTVAIFSIVSTGGADQGLLPQEWRRPAPQLLETDAADPKNPARMALASLGQDLFADASLSRDGTMSCQSCHHPGDAWSDGLPRAHGRGGAVLPRRTPSLVDVAYETTLFRDGRASSLENQALRPFFHPLELGSGGRGLLIAAGRNPNYRKSFETIFPAEGINLSTIAQALAAYQRTLIASPNAVDHYLDGHQEALSPEALAGAVLFKGKAQCATCHMGWRFGGTGFAINGVLSRDKGRKLDVPAWPDATGRFKVPSLRGVSKRPPYMHAGQIEGLEAVLDHYTSPRAPIRIDLSPDEIRHLIAFLRVL